LPRSRRQRGYRPRPSTRASAASPGWSGPSSSGAWPEKARNRPSSDPTTSAPPEPDPRKILAAWGAFITEIGPQVAPILTLVREAAASDTEIAALLEEISAARLERMTINARSLAGAGHLRPGITPGQAADIMWTYSSPELYDLLVIQRGWSPDRFGRFVEQALTAALLPAQDT